MHSAHIVLFAILVLACGSVAAASAQDTLLIDFKIKDQLDRERTDEDYAGRTRSSREGIAYVPLIAPGTWMVRVTHMVATGGAKDRDWDSYSSSLTFRIAPAARWKTDDDMHGLSFERSFLRRNQSNLRY